MVTYSPELQTQIDKYKEFLRLDSIWGAPSHEFEFVHILAVIHATSVIEAVEDGLSEKDVWDISNGALS